MDKLLKNLAFMMVLAVTLAYSVNAQKETKVVVNSDGSYSVIEYPVDKEVTVRLLPMKGITSTGMAHVLRTANGTKVMFDVTGAPSDWTNVYAYAVDPTGTPTLLGPIQFTGGVGKAEFMTPNDRFMLVLSPTEGLTTYDASTSYVFRSEVPSGYTVVTRLPKGSVVNSVASVSTDVITTSYDVPMLGMTKYKGKTTEVKFRFSGELKGLEGKAYLKPDGGKTSVRMKFDDMKKVPPDKRFVLWASGPDGYTKIGQVVHTGSRDEAEIRGETSMADFGLLLTVEDADVDRPTSKIYSTFTVVSP